MDNRVVGILGGGQLGRMLVEAGHRLNIKTVILDAPNAPAKQINALHDHIPGSFNDPVKIRELAKECDVLTYEIEHVDADVLEELERDRENKVEVHPHARTVRVIQDKYLQKEHLQREGVPTAESCPIESGPNCVNRLKEVGKKYGYPFMLKARTLAYDGRGNFKVKHERDIPEAIEFLGDRPLYAEKYAHFVKELAVMVVRTRHGRTHAYPCVETVHENNICKLVFVPARVSDSIKSKARYFAEQAVDGFWGGGVFGVEMFLLENGELLINEIAPRPHNSGHYTIEACATSQYEAHLRAILNLPFSESNTLLQTPSTCSIMLNILGTEDPQSYLQVAKQALTIPGATVHLYGKKESRPGRKLGHITIVAGSMSEAEFRLSQLLGPQQVQQPLFSPALGRREIKPVVAVIMGSDSDLPTMRGAAEMLEKFGVPKEVTIVSAHRTPDRMVRYAREARSRGFKVIIAGAGGAAHLPGMVASETTLPVVGVPVKGSTCDGQDSLLSIVQMPRGVPVATVGINNSTNAGLLALRILASGEDEFALQLREKLDKYISDMEEEVLRKVEILESEGWKEYGLRK